MKKFLSLILALVMALSLTTVAWGAVAETDVAKIGDTGYATLALAVDAVPANGTEPTTITLLKSTTGAGIKLVSSNAKNIIFDFGGYTYTCTDPAVGSSGTESQGFHIQQGNTVKMMNGTIDVEDGSAVKMLIQNYCDLTLENMTVDGTNLAPAFYGDPPVAGPRYTVSVNSGAVVIDDTTVIADAGEFAFDTYDSPSYSGTPTVTVTGTSVIDGDVEATGGNLVVEDGTFKAAIVADSTDAAKITVSGGTFASALPTGTVLATGLTMVQDTNGNLVASPDVTFGDKYDLYLANVGMQTALKNKTPAVPGLSFEEVGAKKNTDGSGRVAYIAANNGQFFVKTTNPTVADYAVTYAGKTDVLYYVTVAGTDAANFYYDEEVKAFTNWGMKCGQINNTGWTTAQKAEDYFMASDYVVYMAAPAGVGTNYLLDGVVVSGVPVGTTIDHHFVASNFKYDAATGANVPTSAICTTCTQTTTAIYKIGKAPANAVVKPLYVDGNVSTIWEVVPVAAPSVGGAVVTPSTDKVTSAETFDAGIAMYVGMSVLAATGSAVVLKKRER